MCQKFKGAPKRTGEAPKKPVFPADFWILLLHMLSFLYMSPLAALKLFDVPIAPK